MVTPAARREAVAHLKQSYEMSERRACSAIGADRSLVRYRHRRPDDAALRDVLRAAAETHRRFGYRRLHVIRIHPVKAAATSDLTVAFHGDHLK